MEKVRICSPLGGSLTAKALPKIVSFPAIVAIRFFILA
jgi:hypothetical protein